MNVGYPVPPPDPSVGALEARVAQLEANLVRLARIAQQGQGAIAVEMLNEIIDQYTKRST